ncbi:MAG: DHHA1 domain-containing protein [Thermomicrobiales bacterium]|nr:DHHA1 domain-containing protein [Thermomicrobiales bacterium]
MRLNSPIRLDPRVRPHSWIDPEPVPGDLAPLHDHKLVHALLYRRGIGRREEAVTFLEAQPRAVIDPGALPDFDAAVDRIATAVRADEKIGIFGDYDVDGTTSVAILGLALRAAGAGDRTLTRLQRAEGYGAERRRNRRVCRCRGAAVGCARLRELRPGQIAYARALGMDVIVVDHHQMHHGQPDGALVVSAYREDGGVYKELSAAGLTWLLVAGLEGAGPTWRRKARAYLDLVVGLIGDVSPMTGASRALVRAGMARLSQSPRPGIVALAHAAKLDLQRLGATDIAFRLAPRINAAGRMGNPSLALDLLLAPNPVVAFELVTELEAMNTRRKVATDETTTAAERLLRRQHNWEEQPVLVVQSEGWQTGVVGIVAARLAETYDRPVIVLVEEDGVLRGSMRSPEGFDVAHALTTASPLLRSHGGHRLAGGLSLDRSNIEAFVEQMSTMAGERIPAAAPRLQIDAELQEKHLSLEIARLVRVLEPFGPENEEPVFILRNTRLQKYDAIGKTKDHLSLSVGNGRPVKAIFFGGAARSRELVGARSIDLAFTLQEGDWNGPKLDVLVKDFRVTP